MRQYLNQEKDAPFFDLSVETLGREELRKLQWEKLRPLIHQVTEHNQFYRRKWREAGVRRASDVCSLDDFMRLPFTTKDELSQDQMENPPYGTNLTFPLEMYTRIHQTSGAFDKPLRWLDTVDSWEWWAKCWAYVYKAAGVTSHDRVFFAFSFGPFIGFWSAWEGARRIGALAISGGGQKTKVRLQSIVDNNATVLLCTPTYALHMAQVAEESGIDIAASAVRITIHSGEPGASVPEVKRRIESSWGARSFDHPSITEVGPVGFECIASPGEVHINEAECIAEVVDPDSGEPVPEGQEGELVLTNLGRPGMPSFRYRTGDLVKVTTSRCECGRSFMRLIGGIRGRVDDVLIVRGVKVFPSAIQAIISRYGCVNDFLIELYRKSEMNEMRIMLDFAPSTGNETRRQVEQQVCDDIRRCLNLRTEVADVPRDVFSAFQRKGHVVAGR